MKILGWLATYALPIAILAFGTVTQGDDRPWLVALLLFAPIVVIGLLILILGHRDLYRNRWFALPHVITLYAGVAKLPNYWVAVTFGGDHIGAGFSKEYLDTFVPESWHLYWAPVMTILLMMVIGLSVLAFQSRWAEQNGAGKTDPQSGSQAQVKR